MGSLGVILSAFIPDPMSTLLILYAIWVPIIVIPFLYAIFSTRATSASAIAAMSTGGVTAYVWEFICASPYGAPGILIGIIAALIATEATLAIQKKH